MSKTLVVKGARIRAFNPLLTKAGKMVSVQLDGGGSFFISGDDVLLKKVRPGYTIDFTYSHAVTNSEGTQSGATTVQYTNYNDVEVFDAHPSVTAEALADMPDLENILEYKPSKALKALQDVSSEAGDEPLV
jgi:hypothetical protein